MGLGKTYTGAEKMMRLGGNTNLVICQKSKIDDWVEHFREHYQIGVFNLTNKRHYEEFFGTVGGFVGVINYDLIFRRPELLKIHFDTVMLDESSIIQNRTSKRSKAILKLDTENVILLSGTPTGGKYEKLWSQLRLLGWNISENTFMNHYVIYHYEDNEGFPIRIIDGYKNVDRLKTKLREHGAHFLKTEDVFDLPEQIHNNIYVKSTADYRKFRKDRIVTVDGVEFVGDTILAKMLYERQLCGFVNKEKLNAFRDIVESTDDRLIVFYNFNAELDALVEICSGRPVSIVNGSIKDLSAYEEHDDSITFIQYQAGAMGLNLQQANKIVYFTAPLSSELFEQSKKRIHRIGQSKPCFYYYLICKNSIEEKIYQTLAKRRDYTDKLFEEEEQR
jgi:SNF2 family DNA or RNA helicase